MTTFDASVRPKINGDTFFITDRNGAVYFRNNMGSFKLEGELIDRWIEKLIPVFNGKYTLMELTDGLSEPHKGRVFDIAALLIQNGFARDVSGEHSHRLSERILEKFGSQIEFLSNFGGSGAHRFEQYRQEKVLAIGSGPFLVSLVAALLESGLPRIGVAIGDSLPTNRERLKELGEHARKSDPEIHIQEVPYPRRDVSAWQEVLKPFDSIMYVSQEGDVEELRIVQAACKAERKLFLPAICLQQAGLAGPLERPEDGNGWESALRRIHQPVLRQDPQQHGFSVHAGALLSNVIVFELFKTVTGAADPLRNQAVYLLNLETLEGDWYSFVAHPMVIGCNRIERIPDIEPRLMQQPGPAPQSGRHSPLLDYCERITSPDTGIFYEWDEGDLKQLPLAQCRVQVADPLSDGPVELLPSIVGTGLTHEEARRDSALAGLEAYTSRLAERMGQPSSPLETGATGLRASEYVGIGAGETLTEAVCRGLRKCLAEELDIRRTGRKPLVTPLQLSMVDDERVRYYLKSLSTLQGVPDLLLEEELFGFPVVRVDIGGRWYSGVDLNITLALRRALLQALSEVQSQAPRLQVRIASVPSRAPKKARPHSLTIPACEETPRAGVLASAMQQLKQHGRRLHVLDYRLDPFLNKGPIHVLGVALGEEVST
ncbi:putative thiazole-containing bacteriocin maturation protein [Paenibacillus sp. MZ04-78.2]|uniref:putative thiazole-containing bacteriocin maturation protein n=1 Tax=Paenibacillus sp. MZ04-78.2 TaxID=2962034 RepID=UPI0020B88F0A|nr:putative thiazole-containing bacteriocin maturation protein [Paenibacillus sp. MZ04-78.2]MCP3772952.1 putative thiazole-containing bacteriocin maturation protein [Paenibacillus sp. MZ04-78.2]